MKLPDSQSRELAKRPANSPAISLSSSLPRFQLGHSLAHRRGRMRAGLSFEVEGCAEQLPAGTWILRRPLGVEQPFYQGF
jgi:hypothetical protein